MTRTSIEWTRGDDGTPGQTWNPVRGCSIVSPGCVHCYAMKQAHRFSGAGKPYDGLTKPTKAGPQWTGVVRCIEDALDYPLKLRKPHRIFVNSMSDLFHEDVPDAFIWRVFGVMAEAHWHTFQVLTKRADRLLAYASSPYYRTLPNVWLGVSVEDQARADERIPRLLETPAAVRWISAEPLLGHVDLTNFLWTIPGARLNRLHWVVVGGESGAGARPCDLAWARAIVRQCQAAEVPVFYKQLGAVPVMQCGQCGGTIGRILGGWVDACGPTHAALIAESQRVRDRKGGDPAEWPEDLRVRQYPK